MRKSTLKQFGFLNLHVLLPVLAVVVVVGCIGGYVVTKSHAMSISAGSGSYVCGDTWRGGVVYASAVGTKSKFLNARDSDSVRNIASKLCVKGFVSKSEAAKYMKTGSSSSSLLNAYHFWQVGLGYSGSNADGVPGATSLKKLGLSPNGF